MNEKRNLINKLVPLIAFILILGYSPKVQALGTEAGTQVKNFATINYSINSTAQDPVDSSPPAPEVIGGETVTGNGGLTTDFLVDNVVDLLVSEVDVAAVQIKPGETQVLTFTLKNEGNNTQDYRVTSTNVAIGQATAFNTVDQVDDIDLGNISVFVDSNGNGTYEAGTDTQTFVNDLGPDAIITVFIVADTTGESFDDNLEASYQLLATTFDSSDNGAFGTPTSETAGADTTGVDVVFADDSGTPAHADDANRDGEHSDQSDFITKSAILVVQKTSVVISDPINNTTNPKRIPGAIIEYVITITNNGTQDATGMSVSDSLATEVTAGTISFVANAYVGEPVGANGESGEGIKVVLNDGTINFPSNDPAAETSLVTGGFTVGGTETLTVSGLTVPGTLSTGGGAGVVTVRIRIQITNS